MKLKDLINESNKDFIDDILKSNDPKYEGFKNTFEWLNSNPSPEEIKKELPFLEDLGKETNDFRGFDKLDEETKKEFIKQVTASNYLYKLALEKALNKKKYDTIPSSQTLYLFNELITYNGKDKAIETNSNDRRPKDRHKEVIYSLEKKGFSITQTNYQSNDEVTITVNNKDLLKTGKGVKKCFAFLLAKSNDQNFNPEIGFSLQELVDKKMYSSLVSARTGIKNALDTLQTIQFSGTTYKGKKEITTQAGILFYHYTIKNGYVTVSVNEKMNIEFIAPYFALIPVFSYGLANNNAFDLCEYIFLQARQNAKDIKEKSSFNISFDKIRQILALPLPEEIKHGKSKQYVIDPILTAVADIEKSATENNNYDFSIQITEKKNYKNIYEWLEGYITVTVNNELKENIVKIAVKKEKEIQRRIEAKGKKAAATK